MGMSIHTDSSQLTLLLVYAAIELGVIVNSSFYNSFQNQRAHIKGAEAGAQRPLPRGAKTILTQFPFNRQDPAFPKCLFKGTSQRRGPTTAVT